MMIGHNTHYYWILPKALGGWHTVRYCYTHFTEEETETQGQ